MQNARSWNMKGITQLNSKIFRLWETRPYFSQFCSLKIDELFIAQKPSSMVLEAHELGKFLSASSNPKVGVVAHIVVEYTCKTKHFTILEASLKSQSKILVKLRIGDRHILKLYKCTVGQYSLRSIGCYLDKCKISVSYKFLHGLYNSRNS